MTSRKELPSDSDGSWTWVDNEDENFKKRADRRRASSFNRTEVEDVHHETEPESDISILTDEEPMEQSKELESKPGKESSSDGIQESPAILMEGAKAELLRPGESELAAIDRRARAYLASTTTSVFFMVAGLLIAVYFQWGCDSNFTSPVQEYYGEPYMPAAERDLEYMYDLKRRGKHKYEQYAQTDHSHAHMMHKNSREKFRRKVKDNYHENEQPRREDKRQRGDKKEQREFEGYKYNKPPNEPQDRKDYKKKGKQDVAPPNNYRVKQKSKHNKNNDRPMGKFVFSDSNENHKEKSKHGGKNRHKESVEHTEFTTHAEAKRNTPELKHTHSQNRKQAFLLNKEQKLVQKELKINAKQYLQDERRDFERHDRINRAHKRNFTGDWYDKMYEGRRKKRQQEERGTWMFERAQGRVKKRDKAHWYFDMMDDREVKRVKH